MNTYKIVFFESDDDAEARSVLISGSSQSEALNHFYDVYPWALVEAVHIEYLGRQNDDG